jgi:hypothetical protein
MLEIFVNKKRVYLPEDWTEVPKKDLPELLRLLYVMPESGSTYHEIMRILIGYTPKQWTHTMQYYFGPTMSDDDMDRSAEALQKLLNAVSWMWKGDLTVAPWDGFMVNGKKWLLFESGFKSMTFGELSNAHINAQAFIKQLVEGDERLNMLVATICRPERTGNYKSDPAWNGDPREPYNEHIARYRADQIKDGYIKEKILVLMYFMGSLKEFFSFYDLFDNDSLGPAPAEDYPGQSMIKNQHLLSEKHIFGGMDATKTANVHDVFQFLEEHRKDVKAENERIKAANSEQQ